MTSWRNSTVWRRATARLSGAEPGRTSADATPAFAVTSIRLRIWLIVFIALLPIAALSAWQGIERLAIDQNDIRDRLRQSALLAASDEQNIFASAEQILRALANQQDVQAGGSTCAQALNGAVRGLAFFPNIERIGQDGVVLCAAIPGQLGSDARREPWWKDVAARREFTIAQPAAASQADRHTLIGILPLSGDDGAFAGTLNIAIDVQWLDALLRYKRLPPDAVVALFHKSGRAIVSSNPKVAEVVFAQGARAPNHVDGLHRANGPEGDRWYFAMAPLIRQDTYVGFAMPESELFAHTYLHFATDLLLPVLMIALASGAIWYATDRTIIRWITLLRRVAGAYARGHYAVRPATLASAPREFRDLGETLTKMARAIAERDTKLRDAVTQKTLLIKEIHHRVKNNLQIVMSLLSLQATRMRDSAARDALEQARTRVNALALVHRILYELDNSGAVEIGSLLIELVEQLQQGFGGERRGVMISVDVPERRMLSAERAIPLTLFAVEALTNAYKHAFGTRPNGQIVVKLESIPSGDWRLTVCDDGAGIDLRSPPSELSTGGRLMGAFAQQLGGRFTTRHREGGGTIVELTFPDPEVSDLSQRIDSVA